MGVGDSALNSSMPLPPMNGMIARQSTMMPMPPSQCVSDRHSSTPRDRLSTFVRIDAPVVEKPDMASKNASVNVRPQSV